MTFITTVEYLIYGLSAFGIGAACYGLFSVARAFYRKDYLLLRDASKTDPHRPSHQ